MIHRAQVPFNDVGALEAVLNRMGDRVAAFLIEPIQVICDECFSRQVS